jgi:integrase
MEAHMAWIEQGPSGTWIARGRDKYQKAWEFDTKFQVEPERVTPENLVEERADSKARAQEAADTFEAYVRGRIKKEEYLARLAYIAERVANGAAKVSVCCFLITWLWEWCIRNRLHHTKVLKLCRLFDALLLHVGNLAEKDAKYLTREHVAKFIFNRRVKGYAPAVINDDINYLKTMARDLELLTGVNVAELLEVEAKETQERLPFKWADVLKIFEALDTLGKLGREWKTFLLIMLYTGLRPCDAALVTRGQIDLELQLIWADASKTRRFAGDKIPRVIHDALFAYLNQLLTMFPLRPEEFLCLNFANRCMKSITHSFNKILGEAGVSKQVVKTPYLQGKFSKKTLYSFRHTFNVLLMSVGADRPQRKTEMGQKTDESQQHYEHDQEPEVIASRRKLINLLPRVPVSVNN